MTKTVWDILRDNGISVRSQSGTQRTTCPNCSEQRKNKKDRCLSVTFKSDGIVWYCWHCEFKGGAFFDSGGDDYTKHATRKREYNPKERGTPRKRR